MTAKGLVVTEVQEDISGLPSTSDGSISAHSIAPSNTSHKSDEPGSPTRKSPLAEMLYMRWLEGLKIKWPNIM
jgi:serine/threonine-protein kinase 24/25/MST4